MKPQMNTDEQQSGKAATKNLTAETLVVRKNRSARAAGHVSFDNSLCVNRTFAPPVRDATFLLTTEEYAQVASGNWIFKVRPRGVELRRGGISKSSRLYPRRLSASELCG